MGLNDSSVFVQIRSVFIQIRNQHIFKKLNKTSEAVSGGPGAPLPGLSDLLHLLTSSTITPQQWTLTLTSNTKNWAFQTALNEKQTEENTPP